jgi:hypothetical protein
VTALSYCLYFVVKLSSCSVPLCRTECYVKTEVKVSLPTPRNHVGGGGGIRGIAPRFVNVGTRWR